MVRPLNAAAVRSTKPASLSESECSSHWMSYSSQTLCKSVSRCRVFKYHTYSKAVLIEEGVQPQSSCTFKPATPALHWSCKPGMPVSLPLPMIPQLTGRWSQACIMLRMLCLPGVQFAAMVAVLIRSAIVMRLIDVLKLAWGQFHQRTW